MTARHVTRRLAAIAVLAVAAPLAACATVTPAETGAATADPCPVPISAPASPSGSDGGTPVVTPTELCALDGRAWSYSVFTSVIDAPDWGDTSEACDLARQAAYWDGWREVQPEVVTLDLADGFGEDPDFIGSVAVAVVQNPDAAGIVARIDAEVDTCLDGSAQSRVEHGDWRGVRGPASGDDGEDLSWWAEDDGSWTLVQAYLSETLTPAEAADFESALETVLDAQTDR
ncbi:hypothetical protein N1028_16340 [Herbiconiux sp. CPCC 203407]|uniref:DUF3558 domain-containing protein n=1 Tax=Herbiconiux oxytropis TaxID=2970915 RepID=A0AA41XKI9_9MICO|nr:hypothetical protein [Herbiconiux oxytropis]MCS5723540.1 hypothetical protein [Herbiconiux oxytropis]MCS5727466.1 hypothetical protein [Herbiconiux oxytropis]